MATEQTTIRLPVGTARRLDALALALVDWRHGLPSAAEVHRRALELGLAALEAEARAPVPPGPVCPELAAQAQADPLDEALADRMGDPPPG